MQQDSTPPVQLSLGVTLRDDATFTNFYNIDKNHEMIVSLLRRINSREEVAPHLLWGSQGCGLTHLLQAMCHEAYQNNARIHYLPIRDILGYSPEDVCEGLDECDIVCVDGFDLVCGDTNWEVALFHLFNKMRDRNHTLLFSSHISPASLPIKLADLKSRIMGCVIFHVESMNDEEKQAALIMRAEKRGMHMPQEVAKYILNRSSRETNALFFLLNRLDEISIQQQRRLTIPFIKEVLGI